MERRDGWYWVRFRGTRKWTIGRFENTKHPAYKAGALFTLNSGECPFLAENYEFGERIVRSK
jgi:hypothetical protein